MSETIRVSHAKDYTTISNSAIRDKRLSFRARGLHHLLLSYPDGWKVKIEHLAGESDKEGKDAIAAALKELEKLGYLVRTQIRDKGRILGYESVIRELPTDSPPKITGRRGKKPQLDKPDTAKPDMVEPQPDLPDMVKPQLDKPDTAKPYPANPVHNKYLFNEVSKEQVSREEISIPPIAPQNEKIFEGESNTVVVEVALEEEIIQDSPTNDKTNSKIFHDQGVLASSLIIPARENHSLSQTKPNGSEQFPWEQIDPVKGWVVETGFLGYVALAVKDYSQFKDLPIKRFQREVVNYVNKAHFDGERKCKLLGYWQDYQDESATTGLDTTLTVSQVVNVAQQELELQRIHNASKRKFEL